MKIDRYRRRNHLLCHSRTDHHHSGKIHRGSTCEILSAASYLGLQFSRGNVELCCRERRCTQLRGRHNGGKKTSKYQQTGVFGLDTRRSRGSSSTMSRVYVASFIQHEDKRVIRVELNCGDNTQPMPQAARQSMRL